MDVRGILAERVRRQRMSLGLNQTELAEQTEHSVSIISRVRAWPSVALCDGWWGGDGAECFPSIIWLAGPILPHEAPADAQARARRLGGSGGTRGRGADVAHPRADRRGSKR